MNNKPWAYVTSAWSADRSRAKRSAKRYCRKLYEAGYTPICPLLSLPEVIDTSNADEYKDYIPNLEKLVATIRSREISACLVLQAKSQLKAIYKDNADTIIGNMDSQIFLGGTEQTTLKDLNAILGKETIDMYNTGQSKGSQESYNMNYQKLGKDLMTMDELAVMDGSKCIVQVRGVRPFLSDKYDLTQHPNYKLTADYDKRNYFDVVKFLSHNLILKADDEYQVIDLTE